MKELIFNIGDVFNRETSSGCLSQYEADCYHIPAYQRGYKWGTGAGGAVTTLLQDLLSAYKNEEKEYYLQYITVKRQIIEIDGDKSHCLEVIDGQQRLTTLSILLSVLAAMDDERCNIADGKLHYAIRSNLFVDKIYPAEIVLGFAEMDWDELVENEPGKNSQDVFYLHGAVSECFQFISNDFESLSGFFDYITTSVKPAFFKVVVASTILLTCHPHPCSLSLRVKHDLAD
ncbi:MAG: DUF262 domain-containing protein, partial [Pseudomonadota bacterium]